MGNKENEVGFCSEEGGKKANDNEKNKKEKRERKNDRKNME